MRNRFSILFGLIAFAFSPLAANAAVVSQDCQGGYLSGFNTMRGVWMDRIGAICRPWNGSSLGNDQEMPLLATSTGGGPQRVECPPGFAFAQLDYSLPNNSGQLTAEHVTLTCKNVSWPHNGMPSQLVIDTTGSGLNDNDACNFTGFGCAFHNDTAQPTQSCDTTEIATGFAADVGQFVGRLTLHCGALPPSTGTASNGSSSSAPTKPPIHVTGSYHPGIGSSSAVGSASGPPTAAPVPGSWYQSCSNASLYQNVLTASCKSTTGLDVTTTLDLTTCNQPASAANINGKLVCENGVASTGGGAPMPSPSPGPTGAGVPGSNVVEGDWHSSEGAMSFTQPGNHRLEGTYAQDSGRIKAEREGGHWVGFWSESKSNHKCDHPRLGSDYWGRMDFAFSDQNRHFDGHWNYCDADPSAGTAWTGDRVN